MAAGLIETVTHKTAWTVNHAEEVKMAQGLTTDIEGKKTEDHMIGGVDERKEKRARKSVRTGKYRLPVLIEKDGDGYFACCPSLQGCYTQGDTYEEALANIKEAIELHIEDRLACGEAIPEGDESSFTTLEVAL